MCGYSTPAHYEQTVRQSGRWMRRVYADTMVHYEQTSHQGGYGECVRVQRYTMSKQSGQGGGCGECSEWPGPTLSVCS